MSRLTLLVRATHFRSELTILYFWGFIGPFWAWKVGPATTVNTCAGRDVGGGREVSM